MRYVNIALSKIFGLVLAPFRTLGPWPAMLAVSLVSGVVILLIFKVTSRQREVERTKNRALARVLELALFKDDIVVNVSAFVRVLHANLLYLKALMRPMLASLPVFVLILPQIFVWFGARPLRPGETALVSVYLPEEFPVVDQAISVEESGNLTVEGQAVRVPSANRICWRLRAKGDGQGWVDIDVNGQKTRKSVTVAGTMTAVSRHRTQRGFWNELANPAEISMLPDAPVSMIEISYPDAELFVGDTQLNWLLAFLVLTLVFGFVLKRPMGITI